MKQKEYLLYLIGWNVYYQNIIMANYHLDDSDKKNFVENVSKLRKLLEIMRVNEPIEYLRKVGYLNELE